jgi:hypothetical protein
MGEYKDKLSSISFVPGHKANREYRRTDGIRVKEQLDDAGNITRYHNTGDTERVDVQINASTVVVHTDQGSEI